MDKLKECPCGKIPDKLEIWDGGQGSELALATPNCCGEWTVEFRTGSHDLRSEECMTHAVQYWNDAPRKKSTEDKLVEALENIKKHCEIMFEPGCELSGIWNIANKALKEVNG